MWEKAALIEVLKSHKRAIAWKLSDIKGIDLEFYTHKILMEEDYEPSVQHQRRCYGLDFSILGEFLLYCLSHWKKMLNTVVEVTNLALNWGGQRKKLFMVKEGIVLVKQNLHSRD
ncbi:hypothetical protein Tco_0447828 [Tanacetum coccineum]